MSEERPALPTNLLPNTYTGKSLSQLQAQKIKQLQANENTIMATILEQLSTPNDNVKPNTAGGTASSGEGGPTRPHHRGHVRAYSDDLRIHRTANPAIPSPIFSDAKRQEFNVAAEQMEKENAHFIMSEAVIAAMEQVGPSSLKK